MERFQSFKSWLLEQEEKEAPTYGCVMLNTNMRDWEDIHTGGIDPNDVYIKPYDNTFGLEENPHMTIIFGIDEDEVDADVIMSVIKENMDDVEVKISKTPLFFSCPNVYSIND